MTPQEHDQSLHNWLAFFGDVLGSEEVVQRLLPARQVVGA